MIKKITLFFLLFGGQALAQSYSYTYTDSLIYILNPAGTDTILIVKHPGTITDNHVFTYDSTANTASWEVAPGAGSGSGTMTTIKFSGVQLGGSDIVTLDFGPGFDGGETPDTEINITLDLTEKQVVLTTEVTGTLPEANGGTGDTDLDDVVAGSKVLVAVTDGANSVIAGNVTIELLTTTLEDTLEARMELEDMQGAVTDVQVPDNITITNLSGTNTGDEPAADLTTPGIIEIATGVETNTGTDATRAVSPDGLDDWTGSAQVVTLGTIATGTVPYANLSFSNNIVAGDLAANSADESEIASGAVTRDKLGFWVFEKTILYPDTTKSAGPDTLWIGRNHWGVSVTVDSVQLEADVDNYDISVVKSNQDGSGGALVDAVQAITNGANHFYITETTITSASIPVSGRIGLALSTDNADQMTCRVYVSW